MRTKKLWLSLPLILLLGSTLVLSSCETVQVKSRTVCHANGVLSLGCTCAETVGSTVPWQLSTPGCISMLEATSTKPPAVFQSGPDYGEETLELEEACRLLGNLCTYEMKATIATHVAVLKRLGLR